MKLTVAHLTPDRWSDLEAIFNAKGCSVARGCWCMAFHPEGAGRGDGNREAKALTRRNSLTSPFLWMLCLTTIVPSMLWWDSTPLLGFYILTFAAVYIGLYWRIVRFRTPRWLVVRKRRS